MVRRIEIDHGQIEIVFRIPPPSRGEGGGDRSRSTQHCTGEHYPAVTAEALAALDLASRDARDNTTLRRAQRQRG
jgi:hypothetical protein